MFPAERARSMAALAESIARAELAPRKIQQPFTKHPDLRALVSDPAGRAGAGSDRRCAGAAHRSDPAEAAPLRRPEAVPPGQRLLPASGVSGAYELNRLTSSRLSVPEFTGSLWSR